MAPRTASLARSPLFQSTPARMPHEERVRLAYKRAIAIGKAYQLTADDIVNTTPRFWELQLDPIIPMDGASGTLISIHLNLCVGTLARRAAGRPDIQYMLDKLLNYEIFGQFCLTEQAHGLDARNLETTATLLADGTIDLHTPSDGAAKYMPPSSPCGIPTMAIVFARFVVNGEDRGVKPFSVPFHDGHTMHKSVTSRLLPPRGSSVPVNHCLTYFNHVSLPAYALLDSPEKVGDGRDQFFDNIYRIIVGTISIAGMALSSMKMGVYIAGRYSQRRKVTDAFTGSLKPIISFPTQQYPILSTLAQSIVFESFAKRAIDLFNDRTKDLGTRHCVASIAKATLVRHCLASLIALGDRCGANGVFEVNQFSVQWADMRGAAIAEGDILGISIRFGIELVLQRVRLPESSNPDSLLARRVTSILTELRDALSSRFKHHRNASFQTFVLPHCQPLIEAFGYRMAYDAAVEDGIDKAVLDMYVASIVKEDRAWFSEVAGISRAKQMDFERNAMQALLPRLDELLAGLDVSDYCTAPIISQERWDKYVRDLPVFTSTDAWEVSESSYHPNAIRAML